MLPVAVLASCCCCFLCFLVPHYPSIHKALFFWWTEQVERNVSDAADQLPLEVSTKYIFLMLARYTEHFPYLTHFPIFSFIESLLCFRIFFFLFRFVSDLECSPNAYVTRGGSNASETNKRKLFNERPRLVAYYGDRFTSLEAIAAAISQKFRYGIGGAGHHTPLFNSFFGAPVGSS